MLVPLLYSFAESKNKMSAIIYYLIGGILMLLTQNTSNFNRNTISIKYKIYYIFDIWTKIRKGNLEASAVIVKRHKDIP